MKKRKPLMISIGLALMSLLLVVSYLKRREQELLDWSRPVSVLVMTRDVLKNTAIEEDMVAVQEVPKRFLQPGALKNPSEAIGRLSISPLMKGEQVLGTKLVTYGTETGLAVKVPAGMRAISISVDPVTGVGGLIKPDNYIDVLATFNFGDEGKDNYHTFTLLEDVRVLAVGADLGIGLDRKGEKEGHEDGPRDRRATVTLALDPQQVQDLILTQESGKISLSLRSLSETQKSFQLKPSTTMTLTGVKERTQKETTYRQYRGRQ